MARVVRLLAVGVVALLGFGGALFIAGEALSDPGGWKGLVLVAGWGIPMVVLVLLALRRPVTASWVLPWALAVAAAFVLVDAVGSLLERHGPVSTVVVFLVAVPCGLLGLHRAGEAGLLVLGAAGVQLLALVAEQGHRAAGSGPSLAEGLGGSTGVLVVPLLICAGLLLVAALLERLARRPGHLHAAR